MHWLFGDQLGPHFLIPGDEGPGRDTPLLMIEARSVFRRRRFHRAKAHLVLSAMRHRAAELGDRLTYVRTDTYREGLDRAARGRPVTVHHPTSYAALRLVRSLPRVSVGPARGFLVPRESFTEWADGHSGRRLRQEDFYRWVRRGHDLLMDGELPAGGRWNLDHENRSPPAPRAGHAPRRPPLPAARGRDRRRGAARPRPLGEGGRGVVRGPGRAPALRPDPCRGAPR